MSEKPIWGIHGGSMGRADTLFLKQNVVALGWSDLGDLTKIGSGRDAFKEAVLKVYPGKKPGAIRTTAGQLFRFVHEMKNGDLIVYPSKQDRHVHIARVEGPYRYQPKVDP